MRIATTDTYFVYTLELCFWDNTFEHSFNILDDLETDVPRLYPHEGSYFFMRQSDVDAIITFWNNTVNDYNAGKYTNALGASAEQKGYKLHFIVASEHWPSNKSWVDDYDSKITSNPDVYRKTKSIPRPQRSEQMKAKQIKSEAL